MTYPYASPEKIAQVEAMLGEPIGNQEVRLLQQICEAAAMSAGMTPSEALGGVPLATGNEVTLLKQLLVILAAN